MKLKKLTCLILLLTLIPNILLADTIYLKTRKKIVCEIVGETAEAYQIKKKDGTYSILYQHDEIKKEDIFAAINDAGDLIYPKDESLMSLDQSVVDKFSDREYQAYLIQMQLEKQEELNNHVKGIKYIMLTSFMFAVGLGLAQK